MERPRKVLDRPPKGERLRVFLERFRNCLPVGSFEAAYRLLVATLNEVEDELTDVPYDPPRWKVDGRLYPPVEENWRTVQGYPKLTRMRSVGHNTYIATNGAVEIRRGNDPIAPPEDESTPLLAVNGEDGKGVWDR